MPVSTELNVRFLKKYMSDNKKNNLIAVSVVVFGIFVAAIIAPKDKLFFGNFAYYWGPQLLTFILIIVFRFPIGILTGSAFIFALYLFAFHSWASSLGTHDALVWLMYLFSFIGSGLGVLVAGISCKRDSSVKYFKTIRISAVDTVLGLFLSYFIMNLILV